MIKALFDRMNRINGIYLGMTRAERSLLELLERLVRVEQVSAQIWPIVERVCAELVRKQDALMTWEPVPLTIFCDGLPKEIRSVWVFVLRAGADTGAERHPNSHQRMMTLEGAGDMRIGSEQPGSDIQWQSHVLVSDAQAPLENRWISIPPHVWHRPVIPNNGNWVVVSFHTVPAEKLIEERLQPGRAGETKQKLYLPSTPSKVR
jgi:hypothetical protein